MITQNPSFFIINPADGMPSAQVRGKWLFFDSRLVEVRCPDLS